MARVKKSEKHHRLTIRDDDSTGELCLVRGYNKRGDGAYLWIGRDGENPQLFSGRVLVQLAKSILAEFRAVTP